MAGPEAAGGKPVEVRGSPFHAGESSVVSSEQEAGVPLGASVSLRSSPRAVLAGAVGAGKRPSLGVRLQPLLAWASPASMGTCTLTTG